MPRRSNRRLSCKRISCKRKSTYRRRRTRRRPSYRRVPLLPVGLLGGKRKSKSISKRKTKKRPEKKTYTLVDSRGIDIGGHYVSRTPKGAAKKAAKQYLPKARGGKVTICIRQMSFGRGHNQIRCYKVIQVMQSVKDMKNLPVWLQGTNKTRIPVKTAVEIPLPVKLKKYNTV